MVPFPGRATAAQARAALDAHQRRLAALANVVGLGVVDLQEPSAGCAVAVYVSRKLPREQLDRGDLVPETLGVGSGDERVEVPTRVIEQGTVRPEVETLE